MDKTGTLTKGVFKVQEVVPEQYRKRGTCKTNCSTGNNSTHPIGKAVVNMPEAKVKSRKCGRNFRAWLKR